MSDLEDKAATTEDSLASRHRKERKDLQATIQALKKTASKGDKKKRKEILEEIVHLELQLDKRQQDELNDQNSALKSMQQKFEALAQTEETPVLKYLNEDDADKTDPSSIAEQPHQQRISKAQKRREKRAKDERERETERLVELELSKNGPRMTETRAITKLLRDRGLRIQPIPSDGDCLYNAIRHQLQITGRPSYDTIKLRSETANYILNNKETLIFYMTNQESGDILSEEEFINYCEAIRTTPAWGGQLELKALSNVLKAPIEVLQAIGPPAIQGENECPGPNLIITYHRHMYSLGEHYNSTRPLNTDDEDDGAEEDLENNPEKMAV